MRFGRYVLLTTDVNVGSVHHFSQYTNTEISTSKSKTTKYDIVYSQAHSLVASPKYALYERKAAQCTQKYMNARQKQKEIYISTANKRVQDIASCIH